MIILVEKDIKGKTMPIVINNIKYKLCTSTYLLVPVANR
jgi:hypothetical protein